jgi:hypothetical protein
VADLKPANLRRKWSTIPKQQHFTTSRHVSARGGFLFHALRFIELARVLMRFDHVVCIIVNANHCVMRAVVESCIADCVTNCVQLAV